MKTKTFLQTPINPPFRNCDVTDKYNIRFWMSLQPTEYDIQPQIHYSQAKCIGFKSCKNEILEMFFMQSSVHSEKSVFSSKNIDLCMLKRSFELQILQIEISYQ